MPMIAAFVGFLAVFVLIFAIGGTRGSTRARLQALLRQSTGGRPQPAQPAQPVAPALHKAIEQLLRHMPSKMVEQTRQRLIVAGEPMTIEAFMTLRVVCFGLFVGLPVLLFATGSLHMGLVAVMLIGGSVAFGAFLPQIWLSQRVSQRQAVIIKGLPDAFDLITTCVEAGLGLDAALARVAEKVEGPFADELTRALRDIGLGKSRRDALYELGQRTAVPDLVTFVNSVIQAEQMGSSVGTVLRVQAAQLRVRRKQRAEEQAYKAPVKMIFPLVLCIFPTLFIVILGPAVITIMKDFPGSK